jgi:hypothetical protein
MAFFYFDNSGFPLYKRFIFKTENNKLSFRFLNTEKNKKICQKTTDRFFNKIFMEALLFLLI